MKISVVATNAQVNALTALVDAGVSAGYLSIRTGSYPTNTTDSDTGTLLATFTLSRPSFATASGGTATAAAIAPDTSVAATGTPGYYRLYSSDSVCVMQGNASELTISGLVGGTLVAGGTCTVSAITVTVPAGS